VRVSIRPQARLHCTPPQVEKHLSKISGPLSDRIDLPVEVPAVRFTQLAEVPPGPSSADLRALPLDRSDRLGVEWQLELIELPTQGCRMTHETLIRCARPGAFRQAL
jgi:hypothetical protein